MVIAVSQWKISTKVLVNSFISILLIFGWMFFYLLPSVEKKMKEEKLASANRILETALSIVQEYDARSKRGELPLEKAQKDAMEIVKSIRYDKTSYVALGTLQTHKIIMHPMSPALDNRDIYDFTEAQGGSSLRKMLQIADEKGTGGLIYEKLGTSRSLTLGYVTYYKPWDWVFVTGTEINDVTKAINTYRWTIVIGTFILGGFIVILTLMTSLMITRPIKEIGLRLQDIAQGEGDLTRRINMTKKGEIGEMAGWVNTFIDKLHDIISQVAQSTTQIAAASEELAATAEEMAAGSNEQTGQTTQVATSTEEMSATVQQVAKNATIAADKAKEAGAIARKGGEVVNETITGMNCIAETMKELQRVIDALCSNSDKIGDIVGVIDDVADQTNLLALNAAIEAARAGEQGRGFAVVADEVRKLAERTSSSTKEIAAMVHNIQEDNVKAVGSMHTTADEVNKGVSLAQKADVSLKEIVAAAKIVEDMVQQIATATEQQSATAQEISANIESITAVSKQNTKAAQDTAASSQEISHLTDELNTLIGVFKLRSDSQQKSKRSVPAQSNAFAAAKKQTAAKAPVAKTSSDDATTDQQA